LREQLILPPEGEKSFVTLTSSALSVAVVAVVVVVVVVDVAAVEVRAAVFEQTGSGFQARRVVHSEAENTIIG
jgi:hypothetical protein